jgi:hypothetical protein
MVRCLAQSCDAEPLHVAGMLHAKSLTMNIVADVAGFPDYYMLTDCSPGSPTTETSPHRFTRSKLMPKNTCIGILFHRKQRGTCFLQS